MENEKEFTKMYKENFSYVYNMTYALVSNSEIAEDVVSETFIKAQKLFPMFNPKLASAKTWLCNIARNTAIDMWRKNSKGKNDVNIESVVEPSFEESPEVFRNETCQEVSDLLKKLSPDERNILVMRFYMDMSNDEIAQRIDSNAKAVSARFSRLFEKCRKLMGNRDFSDFIA